MADSRICSIPDCGKPRFGREWCNAHYTRWHRHGDPLGSTPPKKRVVVDCSIADCNRVARHRGWCEPHYKRWCIHGDPLGGGPDRRTRGAARKFIENVVLHYEGDDCLIWPYATIRGYGTFHADGKKQIVSRYVCERSKGSPPTPEHQAAHSCGNGNGGCVNQHHLSWKTQSGNQADRIIHGTSNRGERHGRAKLTEHQVREIRTIGGSLPSDAIAAQFGVSERHIRAILARRTWTHVT